MAPKIMQALMIIKHNGIDLCKKLIYLKMMDINQKLSILKE